MGSIFVVVANVVRKQPSQMAFIHCNNMVQQIAAATFDPTFRYTVLPRTFERGPHRPDPQRANGIWHLCSVLAIPIEDQEPRR
jgi:hypothetical protein